MPASKSRRWTRAEVLQLIDKNPLQTPRYELVDGELFVTPSPNRDHQVAVGWLLRLLWDYVLDNGIGQALTSPSDTEVEEGTIVQPDVFVVPPIERPTPDASTIHELLLAIEVLSPSGRRGDRGRKRELYQRRVPEYWIVDLTERVFERWLPGHDTPERLRDTIEWLPAGAKVSWTLDLRWYFARVHGEEYHQ